MAPPHLHFRLLHPQRLLLLLPRLRRRSVPTHLILKPLCSSSSSSDYSPARTPPPPHHGPSLRRGRAPPDHPEDPLARVFDLAALRVPAAACAPLERRLRGHLLNWPRVRNVARLPDDDQGALLALSLPSPSPPRRLSAEDLGTPPTATAVARREKLAREFNARGFLRFPNLARLSRPSPRPSPAASRKRRQRKAAGGESGEEAARRRDSTDKDKVYVVEVVGQGREAGDQDDFKGLVGEEGLGGGAWQTGPTRLLLLDEKYAGRGVDELPEAVKVVLDHESHQNESSDYELVHCQLTLFYNYWQMHEVLEAVLPEGVIIPTRFETAGHIVHLNLRDEHLPYKKLIARVISDYLVVLDKNKPKIQTVVNNTGCIQNDYRTMQLEVLADIDKEQWVEGANATLKIAMEILASQTTQQVNHLLLQGDDGSDQEEDHA